MWGEGWGKVAPLEDWNTPSVFSVQLLRCMWITVASVCVRTAGGGVRVTGWVPFTETYSRTDLHTPGPLGVTWPGVVWRCFSPRRGGTCTPQTHAQNARHCSRVAWSSTRNTKQKVFESLKPFFSGERCSLFNISGKQLFCRLCFFLNILFCGLIFMAEGVVKPQEKAR